MVKTPSRSESKLIKIASVDDICRYSDCILMAQSHQALIEEGFDIPKLDHYLAFGPAYTYPDAEGPRRGIRHGYQGSVHAELFIFDFLSAVGTDTAIRQLKPYLSDYVNGTVGTMIDIEFGSPHHVLTESEELPLVMDVAKNLGMGVEELRKRAVLEVKE